MRRHRHRQVRAGNEDRLAKLPIPFAEGQLLALEGRKVECIAANIVVDFGETAGGQPRRRLADGPDRDPGLVVERPHEALGETLEAVLHLRRAPLLMRRVPAHGAEARRSPPPGADPRSDRGDRGQRPPSRRRPRARRSRRALREHRHLPLDLQLAGIGAPRAGRLLVFALLDDGAAEALRRPPDRIEIGKVLREHSLQPRASAAISSRRDIARAHQPA